MAEKTKKAQKPKAVRRPSAATLLKNTLEFQEALGIADDATVKDFKDELEALIVQDAIK